VEVCVVVGEGATFTGTELLLEVGAGVDFTEVLLEEGAGVDFTEVLLEDAGVDFTEVPLVEDARVEADEGSSQPSSLLPVDTSTPLLQVTSEGIWHSAGRALALWLA
jgi:hypothetical protein